ncbi:DUF4912 domain-containing protein [Prochlorococcus sp. MIT 1307]|uniref:DUF4912 domain-containing protein n=1 Tax=Prochlorococcus sp. MIT 1307 TaxID=3096219 RepID=UPI002A763DED|nr:DUF4912 domain-containing protein [Prochlorococcus sp. MIT 1307]
MTQEQDSLARQTLRQLRNKASDLGVPLYSRKSKALLIKQIAAYQRKLQEQEEKAAQQFWRVPDKSSRGNDSSQSKSGITTRVVFLPRDPEWAYVFWEISDSDRKRAQSHGASRLCLRLSDLTGICDGTAHRQTLQEVPVDSHSTEWYLPIPMSDRDYRVELGYRSGSRWISLAFSSEARVPSLYPSDQILDQFVPFSLEAPVISFANDTKSSNSLLANDERDRGLHERLYQTATTNFQNSRVGSEQFQGFMSGQNQGLNDSGVGLWASGRNESGLGGVKPRNNKRSFWLVADAELVVYGSTDPSATVTIGGEVVQLSSSGTFRLQVPFRDGNQEYLIEAKDSSGQQMRNITMKFERTTPEDNTNPNDTNQDEWF